MAIPFLMWPPFFNFQSGSASKIKKNWPKKGHKRKVYMFTRCACTRVCAGSQTILNSLGDQTSHMQKVWWNFDFIWPSNDLLKIMTKHDRRTIKRTSGQADKWTTNCQIYIQITNFHTIVCVHPHTAAINVKEAPKVGPISQATYIRSKKKLKNGHLLIWPG